MYVKIEMQLRILLLHVWFLAGKWRFNENLIARSSFTITLTVGVFGKHQSAQDKNV